MSSNRLRDLIDRGGPLVGTWATLPSPYVVEVLASVGFDWLCIDMQHGLIGDDLLPLMLMAADAGGVPTLVRPRWNDPAAIMRALDAGAAGVLVPLVNDADEAEAASRASRYPPVGIRSWGPMRPVVRGRTRPRDDVVCIVMVETPAAVGRIAEIANVPGIDGVFVGPKDLSLGVSGSLESDLSTHLAAITAASAERGLVTGTACGGRSDAQAAVAQGLRLLTVSSDVDLLGSAATSLRGSLCDLMSGDRG